MSDERDCAFMRRAFELAARGRGYVEPNPVVGCVIVSDQDRVVGEGWHRRFGGPHAEVEALRDAGDAAKGARLYVTLEPCCHHGKTPPCTEAILAAGIRRVVAATCDPFPAVAGGGLRRLAEAGVDTSVGLLEAEARDLNASYWKLTTQGQPWIVAKWAMTLDGKIATHTGDSRWISNAVSRRLVHQIRGESDAVLVGRGTVLADDPLLTARPPGPRVPLRIVLDSAASLPLSSQLVRTADQAPVLVVASVQADRAHERRLVESGCEVLRIDGASW
ncbi:MAG: bifunctional diaminohydroxyphosphoribosylaminopyrimidine deaminase/5-amino-6-(5-phosphoribosylamino)uracil reductase RibD, partial [Pirellulaceae bacterium]